MAFFSNGVQPVTRVRVRATVREVGDAWVEVGCQLSLSPDRPWLNLTHPDRPLLVARRFSEGNTRREARELYAVSALKDCLTLNPDVEVDLSGGEHRDGAGYDDYRYWAVLGAPFTVAFETQDNGTVAIVALL